MDVSTKDQIPFQLKAQLPVSSSKDQLGASGIRVEGKGKGEMKEEDQHKSHTKQIAGSNSIKSDVFKRKY